MSDQLRINDRGELEPVTWDGEPLYCRETVSESQRLFKPEAFEQMKGQAAMDTDQPLTVAEIRKIKDANPEHPAEAAAEAADDRWMPIFSPWRHGGWYVDNVSYPSGAVGCVSRNYPDRKWRIACDSRNGDHTYPNRDAAARAERDLIARGEL